MKKLILLIVEGASDRTYLLPLKKYIYKETDKKLEFKITNGDILTDIKTSSLNVNKRLKEMVNQYLTGYKYQFDDLYYIVHVIDLDGTFINDSAIRTNSDLKDGEVMYYRDRIECNYINNISIRNYKKSQLVVKLSNLSYLKLSEKISIPYKLLYFSTNIDDYFFGEQNLSKEEKINQSDEIYDKYKDNPILLKTYIENNNNVDGDFKETWLYARKGLNSLSRCTNFDKFFSDIIDKIK